MRRPKHTLRSGGSVAEATPSSPLLPEEDQLAELCARYGRDMPAGMGGVSGEADYTPVPNVGVAIVAAAVAVALYANTLGHDYTFDDFAAVQDNADVNWSTPFLSTLVRICSRRLKSWA